MTDARYDARHTCAAVTVEGRALSPREREVMNLVAEGLSNTAVASRLCIGVRTVNDHLESCYRKLGAHTGPAGASVRVRAVVAYLLGPTASPTVRAA